ncbi:MAG TPA: hypothetical protein VNM90_13625, partial [Haliangium sp.]|nr:hypothetical protein [Haliangium sp.]
MADHHQSLPPQETLAVMNSHLGRFLVQADELIQECRTFGESLRTSLEAELDKLSDTVAHALDSAAQRTAEQAGARFGAHLEAALGTRLAELRQKLDDMGRLADRAAAAAAHAGTDAGAGLTGGAALPAGLPVTGTAVAPPRHVVAQQPWPRGLTALVAAANLMLAALLILMVIDMHGGEDRPGGAGAGAGAGADASVATAGTGAAGATGGPGNPDVSPGATLPAGAAWAELCQPLAERADPAKAHALVAAAASAACGDRAGAVTANALAGVCALPASEQKPDGEPGGKIDGK